MKKIIFVFFFILITYTLSFSAEKCLDVKFIPQCPPGQWTHSMNCGPTSLVMIASYFKKFSPTSEETLKINNYLKIDENGSNGTSDTDLIDAALNVYNLKIESLKANIDAIKKEIDYGKPVIVALTSGYLSNRTYNYAGAHFIVIIGYNDNFIIANDPGTTYGQKVKYKLDEFEQAFSDQNNLIIKCLQNLEKFKVIETSPSHKSGLVSFNKDINIKFNYELSRDLTPENLKNLILVSGLTGLKTVNIQKNTDSIIVKGQWIPGEVIYIKVKKQLKSSYGYFLENDYEFSFQIAPGKLVSTGPSNKKLRYRLIETFRLKDYPRVYFNDFNRQFVTTKINGIKDLCISENNIFMLDMYSICVIDTNGIYKGEIITLNPDIALHYPNYIAKGINCLYLGTTAGSKKEYEEKRYNVSLIKKNFKILKIENPSSINNCLGIELFSSEISPFAIGESITADKYGSYYIFDYSPNSFGPMEKPYYRLSKFISGAKIIDRLYYDDHIISDPKQISIDNDGSLYLVCGQKILVYYSDLVHRKTIVPPDFSKNDIAISSICFDSLDNIYVLYWSGRWAMYSKNLKLIFSISCRPSSQKILLSDNGSVFIFNDGQFLEKFSKVTY